MSAPALSSTAARVNGRLVSVDLLRGIVMVVMALDHTRGYFSEADFGPADLNKTSVALFLTRWTTHFCAPVFVFLAGTGAYFSSLHAETKAILARFPLTRGFWLIFLQPAVEPFAWSFTPDYTQIGGGVLWAIGWSMMVLAALIFLPLALTATFGIALIALHNLFDAVRPEALGVFGPVWAVLHTGYTVTLTDSLSILPYYP